MDNLLRTLYYDNDHLSFYVIPQYGHKLLLLLFNKTSSKEFFLFFCFSFPKFDRANKNWLAPKKDRIEYMELICFGYKNSNVCIMWIKLHLHSIKYWKKVVKYQKRKKIKRLNKNNNVISAIIFYLHFLIQFRLVDWFSRTQCN